LALQACGKDGGPAQTQVAVRDSAGVHIVENRGDPAPLHWTLGRNPVDIGGGAAGELHGVTSATRLDDGRIVVANSGASALEIFGADGKHLRTVGRAGDGPGEFRALFWVGRLGGDSIAAWDPALGRLSVFDPGGVFVRTVAPRGPLGMFPMAAGVLGDGRVLLAVSAPGAGGGAGIRVRRDSITYVTLGQTGDVQPVGRFPGTEMLMSGGAGGGLLMRPLPFGRQTVAAARGGRVYVGTGDRFEVLAYEPGHGVRAIMRVAQRPVPVTRADIDDYRRTQVTIGAEGDARLRSQNADLLAKAPYPREMPPFTAIAADPDGNLWLQPPKTASVKDLPWMVLAPDGRALGTVDLPAKLAVQEIGRHWVLGTMLDDDEVEHVRLYRLVKRG
jgi:hypothetical protein